MEVSLQLVEEGGSRRRQPRNIIPEPVAGQLLVQKPPDPLHAVQGRGVDRQPERRDAARLPGPPRSHGGGAMIADVVHDEDPLVLRPCLGQLRQEGGAAITSLALGEVPNDVAGPIVHSPEDGAALVRARRRHRQRTAPPLPDLDQVRMGVAVTFIHGDKPESTPGSSPLFWSSLNPCLAEVTASASWRWVRS